MPNHCHFVVRCIGEHSPGDIVREVKKATSNLILRQLEAEEGRTSLAYFAQAVKPGQDKQHAVWQSEYQAKNVFSPVVLAQKLEYIHNNPLQPHWNLAARPEEYVWSSARYYLTGGRAIIPLSDARELLR